MFQSTTVAEAAVKNGAMISSGGNETVDLIGLRTVEAEGPLAFIVRSKPGGYLRPHFHTCDQFQVFVGGSGKIGRHDFRIGSLHYADAYTPYGPIESPEGVSHAYETLRSTWCKGLYRAPEDIAMAKGRRGRNLVGQTRAPEDRAPGLWEIFSEPDGVAAREFVAGPGDAIPALSGSGYYVVLEGEVICQNHNYPVESCFWATPGDRPDMAAGPQGAVLVMLTFAHDRIHAS